MVIVPLVFRIAAPEVSVYAPVVRVVPAIVEPFNVMVLAKVQAPPKVIDSSLVPTSPKDTAGLYVRLVSVTALPL